MKYDLIIIGGGVSAYSAAMYAGRFGLKTLVISKENGGTLIWAGEVSNYPGFKQISGLDLANKIREHALDYDIKVINDEVIDIKKSFKVITKKKKFETKTVIIATGTEWRKLKVPGEKEYTGKGVHYCALCDGPIYKNKIVGVVGGSDSAAKEALLLSEYAKKVYIIYRKEKIRPEPINYDRVINNKKISIIKNTKVLEIKGDKLIHSVIFDKPYKGKKEFKLDALFIEIGHIPLSQLAKKVGAKLNEKKEIIINRQSETSVPGLFAAGDVVDTRFKQAITGVAEGVTAAYYAYQYLQNKK